jgi:hypothetical protein
VTGKFLDNLCRSLAVRKERNIAVPQTVKTYRVSLSVCQFKVSYPQIFPDKLCRIDRLAKGHKDPVVSIRPCMGFQCRQNVNQYRRDKLFGLFSVLGYRSLYPTKALSADRFISSQQRLSSSFLRSPVIPAIK